MKNKKLTWLLVGIVVLIWGVILRRVVSFAEPDGLPAPAPGAANRVAADTSGYTLRLDYRDPFLEEHTPRKAVPPRSTAVAPATVEEPYVQPPDVRFKGVIRQAGKLYAILENGGTSEIRSAGETVDQWSVQSITADSVLLRQGKHTFVVNLQ